jgi:hypothetical protein
VDGPIASGVTKVAVLSTESILGAATSASETGSACAACGAPLASDQRYCLECGERRASVSEFLRSGPPRAAAPPASPPGSRPPEPPREAQLPRSNALSLLAGIGVLLLAMGVGVLIGRSGGGTAKSAPAAEVVTVAGTGTAGGSSAEEAFSDDWPSGKKGYTIQLQTLPVEGTTVAAVSQARTAATGKGAGSVGALKSEDFPSLTAGNYLIYSGVYHKRAEAQKALGSLKKSFPAAKIVEVSEEATTSTSGAGSTKGSSGSGSDLNHPAPPSVLEGETKSKGKSFEEKSKNLPDVVSTG